jgi:ketosteroid isomerase-like protein
VHAGGDVAFATALIRCTGQEANVPVELAVRLTLGLRKLGGGWQVVHEHHSIPAV